MAIPIVTTNSISSISSTGAIVSSTIVNLFTNPSFEVNTNLWGLDADFSRVTTDSFDGIASVKQVSASGFGNLTTQNDSASRLPVVKNTQYVLTFYYKLTINSGVGPNIEIHDNTPYAGSTIATDTLPAAAGWTKRTITFTTNNTGFISFRLYNNNGNVVAYYDNFQIDSPFTARGVQFGTTANPDRSVDEAGSFSFGVFTETLPNLFPNNTYYVRGYATNSSGTGYGDWVSFMTLADVYSITIGGVDRTADIESRSIHIEDTINDKQTVASMTLIDRRSLGVPTTDQEIIITLNSGVRIFAGYVLKTAKQSVRGTLLVVQIDCVDYTRLLDRNLVNKTYIGYTDQAIIQDIINTFCQGFGITYTNVQLGVTIDQIAFNYIQPSKALRVLSDLTGRNWYIDYNKDVHYFPITTNPAPFNITDSQLYSSGQGYYGLQITSDASQIKNRVYVRGGTKLSDATNHTQKGDGVKKKFNLPDKPHSVSISVNGVSKTLGIKNIDTSGFDWYLNYDEKYVEQDASATVLATGDSVQVTYTYDIPILVAVDNTTSIAASGIHEFIIVDKSITTTVAARNRATAELTDYANNIIEGSFQTYSDGFRSGQYVNINSTVLGIVSTNYMIQKVQAVALGAGKYEYTIYLASAKTMGIIRFLLEQLESNKNLAQVATNEVLDNLLSLNDSLDPNSLVDVLTIDSAGPYRTWCTDSLQSTPTTRLRWNLGQWK